MKRSRWGMIEGIDAALFELLEEVLALLRQEPSHAAAHDRVLVGTMPEVDLAEERMLQIGIDEGGVAVSNPARISTDFRRQP